MPSSGINRRLFLNSSLSLLASSAFPNIARAADGDKALNYINTYRGAIIVEDMPHQNPPPPDFEYLCITKAKFDLPKEDGGILTIYTISAAFFNKALCKGYICGVAPLKNKDTADIAKAHTELTNKIADLRKDAGGINSLMALRAIQWVNFRTKKQKDLVLQ